MAYVDQNGLIMIDEIEAAEDIKKLSMAKESLNEALETINQIVGVNSAFQGDTATEVETSSEALKNRVVAQIAAIDEAIKFINQVVENYKLIDEKMKNQINSTL